MSNLFPKVPYTFTCNFEWVTALKSLAHERHTSVSQLIRDALQAYYNFGGEYVPSAGESEGSHGTGVAGRT